MANNRLYLCAVDEDNQIIREKLIGKHMAGPWFLVDFLYDDADEFINSINDFLRDTFIDGYGISLKDDYMDTPMPGLWHYNSYCSGEGHWEFIKDKEEC